MEPDYLTPEFRQAYCVGHGQSGYALLHLHGRTSHSRSKFDLLKYPEERDEQACAVGDETEEHEDDKSNLN